MTGFVIFGLPLIAITGVWAYHEPGLFVAIGVFIWALLAVGWVATLGG